jgi:hypothetical protein
MPSQKNKRMAVAVGWDFSWLARGSFAGHVTLIRLRYEIDSCRLSNWNFVFLTQAQEPDRKVIHLTEITCKRFIEEMKPEERHQRMPSSESRSNSATRSARGFLCGNADHLIEHIKALERNTQGSRVWRPS